MGQLTVPCSKCKVKHYSTGGLPLPIARFDAEGLRLALSELGRVLEWTDPVELVLVGGAAAILTGDALGQVSSQTLQNLAVVSRATELPILRPLVGSNKDEIIDGARRIGTFELSKVVDEYCAMVPRKPATRAALRVVEEQEARLAPGIVEKVVAERSVFDLRAIDLSSLDEPGLAVDRPPPGARLIDLRRSSSTARSTTRKRCTSSSRRPSRPTRASTATPSTCSPVSSG